MVDSDRHETVLLKEAVEWLVTRSDGLYLDATFGRGGHSGRILGQLSALGRLIALDRDPAAERYAHQRFDDERFYFERANFDQLDAVIERRGRSGQVDGILLDLGVSSPQLDQGERGFSFQREGPLDMRMDPDSGLNAADWLASVAEAELARVLKVYGEERFHRRVARAIVAARGESPLRTTRQLAELIAANVPTREAGKHPATRSFQAIRIAVNDELGALERALPKAIAALAPAGRLVVIAFHSLEDRLVKNFIQTEARGQELPPGVPWQGERPGRRLKALGKVRPRPEEMAANPRARSAIMRMAERLA